MLNLFPKKVEGSFKTGFVVQGHIYNLLSLSLSVWHVAGICRQSFAHKEGQTGRCREIYVCGN